MSLDKMNIDKMNIDKMIIIMSIDRSITTLGIVIIDKMSMVKTNNEGSLGEADQETDTADKIKRR